MFTLLLYFSSKAFAPALSTTLSTSQRVATSTLSNDINPLMWSFPRPLIPITATRIRSFAPKAVDGMMVGIAIMASELGTVALRISRRVNFFIFY